MTKIALWIGICLFVVVAVSAGLNIIRQRIKRRNEPHFDVPGFLRNPPEPSDDTRGSLQTDGINLTEVYLSRRRGPRKDGEPRV